MNIDDHVNSIVQNIVAQITTQVQSQAMLAIEQKITEVVNAIDYTPVLSNLLNQKLDQRLSVLPIDAKSIETELNSRVNKLALNISAEVKSEALKSVNSVVANYTSQANFKDLYKEVIASSLQSGTAVFADNSIPSSAIQVDSLKITGDNVVGGIITNFGSTGIDDKSTNCQLSIFDDVTVIENNLLTKDLTVKGTVTIEGDLNVTGKVPESSALFVNLVNAATNNVRTSLDKVVFDSYADMVFKQIRANGLDLSKITVNGNEMINGPTLGSFITSSNLQKVGVLTELQVSGETLLSETLYTSNKRTGINTIEPSQALSVWDQEVEIGFGKQSSGTAVIETPRNQTLVLSSNGKNNISLNPDGSTTVNKIAMGTMSFSVGTMPPSDDQPKGSIVFNSNPSLGGPLGWVSLGNATWANFGIID